ncbi:MAG: FAD-binding oxidoreductase [Patescibacteria group bacterium]
MADIHTPNNLLRDNNVFWYTAQDPAPPRALSGAVRADAVIVGGGMTGLSCAQKLRDAGLAVVVLERDFCGAGASGKTSGFITPDSEIVLSAVIASRGPARAKRIWEFVLSGVEVIRNTIGRHGIACDYQIQDSLFISNSRAAQRSVEEEHRARASLGYTSRLYDMNDIKSAVGSDRYAGGVRFPDTFGINSYLYCQGLRAVLADAGVPIYEGSGVTRVSHDGARTAAGAVYAKHVIVCTDRFLPDLTPVQKEIYHVQTFLGVSQPLADRDAQRVFPDGNLMVWDTDLVYNYFRMAGQNRILLGGGDLRYTYARAVSANTSRFKKRLERYFARQFPQIPLTLEYVWPGMLGVSKDLLPIMGPNPAMPNVWYVGAATGLPWAAALGVYAADRILSGRDEFDEEFSWRRRFFIGPRLQTLLTTPLTYAVSHGIAEHL